ncbi:RICIN domain-containing protein [Allokutzneria albata]|uniref:Ricin-type beta-trefoil lectin domain-containing protein n=1 Tax=Allokutzneria albata TaxID=211114 RepID=A0A1G9UKC9_ALLAB|nr:RICIN domain-containing protein [Allokutzneria albata]SDM60382.1 Ricin-type beta-trefoil lectin domain-containing protein [Allokutzneria albata]
MRARTKLLMTATAVALVAGAPLASANSEIPEHARQGGLIENVLFEGKVLDVEGARTESGTPVVLFEAHRGFNQQFQLVPTPMGYQLRAKQSGKCVQPVTPRYGAQLVIEECGSAPENFWFPEWSEGNLKLRNRTFPMACVTAQDPATGRQNVTIEYCRPADKSQEWKVVPV